MEDLEKTTNVQIELIRKLKICFGIRVKGKEQTELIKKKSELLRHLEDEEVVLKDNLENLICSAMELDELFYERSEINDELIRRKGDLEWKLGEKSKEIVRLKKKNEE